MVPSVLLTVTIAILVCAFIAGVAVSIIFSSGGYFDTPNLYGCGVAIVAATLLLFMLGLFLGKWFL